MAPVNTDITATYDQNIDTGGSVTDRTFAVHAMFTGQIVNPPHGNAISVVTDTITFNPDNDFKPGETIQVIATDGIQNTLAEPSLRRVWEFRVSASGGTGEFVDAGQSLGDHSTEGVALGDLDGDGDLDAFVANGFDHGNRVWSGDGSGNFTDSGHDLGNHRSYAVSLGDVDGDGDLDAFAANYTEGNRVWINDGSGNFTDSGQALGNHSSEGVALGDLDGDGDLDAFVTNLEQGNRVWNNDGSGNFTDSGQTLGSQESEDVALGDLNGDGAVDAFVTNINATNRAWINDGSGNFTESGQILGNHDSRGVALGDLDSDGDLDAFVTNRIQANRVWTNDGSGNFTDGGQQLGDHHSYAVSLGDLDGDGDLDAFVANGFPGEGNRVWLNQELPQVTEVLVRGSAWTQTFLNHLDSLSLGTDGFSIAVGSLSQLDALPWLNIDQILIRFNEQVNVDLNDLTLTGVNVATYSLASVTTGTGATGDFEAVWTLTAPIASDKLRIRLDGTTGGAVTDTSGNALDGEWIDTVSTYPSGDVAAGGDFAFRFNVLPADFNGDGVVTLNPDLQNLLAGNGASIGAGTYSPFIDLNGDGVVTLNPDLQTGLSNNGTFLPLGDPIAPGTPGEGTSPTLGAATATPATSATTKPDGTTVAVERVIAIRSRNQASEPPLNTTMFASDRTATDSIFVDSPGVLDKKDLTSGAILDLDDLDSIVSVDLLSEADSIF